MTYNTKPFDINQARAGAPVGCETERNKIEIFKYTDHSIFGSIRYGDEEEVVTSWDINGKNDPCLKSDLVMLPLGYCDGKPVFVGDHLYDLTGRGFLADASDTGSYEVCIWPKSEPKYPETRMKYHELQKVIDDNPRLSAGPLAEKIANEAIRRAISDADVFTKAQVTAVLEELRNICDRQINPYNIRQVVDGTDWDAILKAGM